MKQNSPLIFFYENESQLIEKAEPVITLTDGTLIKFNPYVASAGGVIMRTEFSTGNNNLDQLEKIKNGYLSTVSFMSSTGKVTKTVTREAAENIHNTLNCILALASGNTTAIATNNNQSTSASVNSSGNETHTNTGQSNTTDATSALNRIINNGVNNYKDIKGPLDEKTKNSFHEYSCKIQIPGSIDSRFTDVTFKPDFRAKLYKDKIADWSGADRKRAYDSYAYWYSIVKGLEADSIKLITDKQYFPEYEKMNWDTNIDGIDKIYTKWKTNVTKANKYSFDGLVIKLGLIRNYYAATREETWEITLEIKYEISTSDYDDDGF